MLSPQDGDRQERGSLPEIDSERCVHALAEIAGCRACVDACPRQAWALSDEALELDSEACDGCGLCRPACPEGAIRHDGRVALRNDPQGPAAYAACERSGAREGEGVLPCVHALGLRDLLHLHNHGLQRIFLSRGDCARCPRGSAARIEDLVGAVNGLLAARGLPTCRLEILPADSWEERVRALEEAGTGPRLSRRGFLRGAARAASEDGAAILRLLRGAACNGTTPLELHPELAAPGPLPSVPEIDPGTCSGCDACARLCSHQAIRLERDEQGLAYRISPERCSGCGLCADVCEQGAVQVRAWTEPGSARMPLDEGRCRACGVSYHWPAGTARETGLCPVCQIVDHRRNLYQVLP